ncbi:MAG TPA: farnesyl diphosphate synthase [Candidatus Binatia bacterium]|nr:farnesyl diphosphate synthase [Candidatus Binatia bacterium]
MTAFGERLPAYLERLRAALDHWLPPATQYPARLHEAMRYAADGGKRLRPLLIYAAGEVLGVPARTLDPAAVAVELVHAYSLVHDDLPAMDDDDLRRGLPTCHCRFDEATAILAGDALQTLAFQVLARDGDAGIEPLQRLKMIEVLAEASGSRGMCGGQAIDLAATGRELSLPELEAMHVHKTGALIRGCVLMACYARAPLVASRLEAMDRYGKWLGLAFQIQDDVLDVEGDAGELGKNTGKDHGRNKPTYPSVMGLSRAKQRAHELFDDARAALAPFGDAAAPLLWLADHVEGRRR